MKRERGINQVESASGHPDGSRVHFIAAGGNALAVWSERDPA